MVSETHKFPELVRLRVSFEEEEEVRVCSITDCDWCVLFTVWSNRYIYRTYDNNGKCTPIGGAHRSATLRSHNLQKPARLYWNMTPELAEIIDNAVKFAQKVIDPTVTCNLHSVHNLLMGHKENCWIVDMSWTHVLPHNRQML